jgi:hypothetical protein
MSDVFAFRCSTPDFKLPKSTLVIFAGPSGFNANTVLTAISDETKSALAPEFVIILVPRTAQDRVGEITDDEGIFAALAVTTIVGVYAYDPGGKVSLVRSLRGTAPRDLSLGDIRRQGLSTLFRRRGGAVEAGPSEHFVKPSKKLDTRFLRASHALSEGAEIFFVALWVLPFLEKFDVRHIHVDSSSIASVALAASLLRGGETPLIRTFQSYEGLGRHSFHRDRHELVLISASQSGSLALDIKAMVKEPELIVTLFSTAAAADGTSLLCDLRYDAEFNLEGLAKSRPLVNPEATRAIRLIGEHFTAEARPPRLIVPVKDDAPTVVVEYLAKLQGQKVFRTHKSSLRGETRAIWIDAEKLRQTTVFSDWIRIVVSRLIPVATKALIYFGSDPASKPFADAIIAEAGRQGVNLDKADLLSLADIETRGAKASWPEAHSTALVIGGITGHGAELLAASRALREYASESHRLYLTSATIPSSGRALAQLGANLRFPSHQFESMFVLVVDRQKSVSSWQGEITHFGDNDDLPPELVDRMDTLRKTSIGLTDNLFLPSPNGALKLRENFAFWPDADCTTASQSDVFTTISVILENLRSGPKVAADRRLANSVYDRAVLSTETFARFNDGVIQAAFLRAALPVELNYTDAPDESRIAADLIIQMAELFDSLQGEALSEFLLAIILRRMQLCDVDLARLKLRLSTMSLDPIQNYLLSKLP